MNKTKLYLILSLCFFIQSNLAGQSDSVDFFRNMGKMYVVVAVLVAVFIGIVIFLVYLDKRIKKLENNQDEH